MFVCVGVCVTVIFFVTDKSHRLSRSREIVTHYGQEAVTYCQRDVLSLRSYQQCAWYWRHLESDLLWRCPCPVIHGGKLCTKTNDYLSDVTAKAPQKSLKAPKFFPMTKFKSLMKVSCLSVLSAHVNKPKKK